MASVTEFKQHCPSCGGVLTIKNPALIGKKIDCPKCQYRFVVDEPGSDTPPSRKTGVKAAAGVAKNGNGVGKPAAKTKPGADEERSSKKKKKKSEGGMKGQLILAIVGVVVFIGAGVGIYFAFFNDSKPTTTTGGGPQGGGPGPGVPPPGGPGPGGPGQPEQKSVVGKWKGE